MGLMRQEKLWIEHDGLSVFGTRLIPATLFLQNLSELRMYGC